MSIIAAKMIKKISAGFIFVLFVFTGCGHMIKTDMDTYLQNQGAYKRKIIVFTTDVQDLLKRYELYQDKKVELTALVTYFGKEEFPTWYLTLEEDGKKIRAYEDNYRRYISRDALQLLIWAKSEGGEVTVRGKLKEDGIELSQLAYNDYFVNTNVRPYWYRHYYRHYYRPYYGYRPHYRYGYGYHYRR
jgi:hypothetical protein